jgi:hypothetical protein
MERSASSLGMKPTVFAFAVSSNAFWTMRWRRWQIERADVHIGLLLPKVFEFRTLTHRTQSGAW